MSSSDSDLSQSLAKVIRWLSPQMNLKGADLLEELEKVVTDGSGLGFAAGWMLARASPHPEVVRSFSFLLTASATHYSEVEDKLGVLLDLVWQPPEKDPSTLINLATAIHRILPACGPSLLNLVGLALPNLVQACLQSVPLAVEAAVDLLLDLDGRNLAPVIFGPIERTKIGNASIASDPRISRDHLKELSEFRKRLEQTRKKASADFEFSPLVRFQETLRRLHASADGKSWQSIVASLANDYDSRLREWGLLADVRRAETQVHQLRVMSKEGDTPSFNAVARVVQLWQAFVGSFDSPKEPVFRPFAAANGSFVLNLAVTSVPSEWKGFLLEAKTKDLSSPNKMTKSEIPPALFDLLTMLANDGLRVECSIADPVAEPFQASIELAPKSRPAAPSSRRRERWIWDLRSLDVPQADRIERVFEVIELVNKGEEPSADNLGIEPRQVAYYRRAAISLDLLAENGQLTVAGERLVGLSAPEKLALAAVLFETSACGGAWTDWANAKSLADVDPDTAKQFLAEIVDGLNEVTAGRRAKTLSAWHKALMPYHYRKLGLDPRLPAK